MSDVLRVPVRVKPGSSRPGVGGEYDGALVVAVSAPAVDGRATEAVLASVASAFGLRRRDVRLVAGRTSRAKVLEIEGDAEQLARVRDALLRPD